MAVALIATACGDDDATSTTSTTATPTTSETAAFPVTVRGAEIRAQPMRIVSGSPTHTEVLYAIGAGDRVVATDFFSNYPPAAEETEKFDSFSFNVEAVAALDPDLVVIAFDPGGVISGLEALGIPTLLFAPPGPTTLDEVYAEWMDVGTATGDIAGAEALVVEARAEIDDLLSRLPEQAVPITYFFELDPTLFTVGHGSLIDTIMQSVGLQSIVPPDAGPFPQLSPEALLDADPQYVFLADTAYGESGATFVDRPGFDSLTSVANGTVVELDSDVASRWGPRIVDLIRTVVEEVHG